MLQKQSKMKTCSKFVFLFLFCGLTSWSYAQLAVGLKAGLNFANVSASQGGISFSFGAVTVTSIGAVLEIGVSEKFAIQPEVALLQKGFALDLSAFSGIGVGLGKATQKLNYLEITPLAKFKFGGEGLGGYLAAGPSFGYALSGTVEDDSTGEKEDVDFEEDSISRSDISLAIGGGIKLGLGSISPFADVRYLAGISNLATDTEPDEGKVSNRGLLLTVGVLFSL